MSLLKTPRRIRRDQTGSVLIEVLVSSILLVITAVGVFGAFDAATRSTAEERHRARAHAIAEADLSRMRALRISDLSNLNETKTVTQDGAVYTVVSRAEFVTDSTGTASCESGVASADYLKISSTVTWPSIGSRPPVYAASIVAPPNGSVSPNSGSLAIAVEDSQNVGIPGVVVSGSGAGTFSGSTGTNGCVIFGNLPEGNYTLTVSASGRVDRDGNPPAPQATSVVGESTNTVVLQYDQPGSIPVSFTTVPYGGGAPAQALADSIIVLNTGMTAARLFPPTPGPQVAQIAATSLFPFSSAYALYAGTCEGDNPNPLNEDPPPAPASIASVLVPPGGSQPATVQLPALHLTVYQGADPVSLRAPGATVKVRNTNCSNFLRTFTTNPQGQLDNPGFPYSDYEVCAHFDLPADVPDLGTRHATASVSLNDPGDVTAGTILDLFPHGASSQTGPCP